MTKEELFELIKAGFTKDEIVNLVGTKEFIADQKEPEDDSKEVANSENKGDNKEAVTEASNEVNDEIFNKLNESIATFTKKLESFNVMNAEQDRENKGNESLEDLLARVLTPDGKEL